MQRMPMVLGPPNDLLGLAIAEGVEDALSVYQSTGLGTWASGGASGLPALANVIPMYVECIIFAHPDDKAGRDGARKLASALRAARTQITVAIEGIHEQGASGRE